MAEFGDVLDGIGKALINNNDGTFSMKTDIAVDGSDIEIGAVELKDATTTNRAAINSSGELSVTFGTGATGIGKVEDAASASGDVGIASMAVQKATPADTAADGDYSMLQMSAGRLWVDAAITPGTAAASLGKAEDGAHASGDVGVMALAVQKATPADLGADGDYGPLQVSGGRAWVSATVDAALPAGTNAIGKLAANSGVDIGDVDILSIAAGDNNIGNVDVVTLPALAAGTNNIGDVDVLSLIPGTGATNAGKAVDDAAGATDTGSATLAVRDDALAALTPLEGDYVNLRVDANGALWTHDDALDAALGGSELQVDVVGALPAGTNAIGKLAANSGVDIGDVDVLSIAAGDNNIGNVDVVTLPALAAGTNNIGDVDVLSVIPGTGATNAGKAVDTAAGATDTGSATLAVRDDALGALTPVEGDYVNLRVDANGALWTHDDALDAVIGGAELQVDVVGALPAGTNAIGKLAANSGVDIGDVDILSIAAGDNNIGNVDIVTMPAEANSAAIAASLSVMDDWDNAASDGASVSGDVAHDAADAGEPAKVGGKAYNFDGTAPQAVVAEADRVNAIFTTEGRQMVETAHPFFWDGNENNATAQTNNAIVAAPGASLSLYITDVVISNGATAGTVKLVEDTAGTPVDLIGPLYLANNAGVALHFKQPIKVTANKDLGYTSVTVTTHTVFVSGYTAA